ncbi:Interferon omega-1 [Gossypium australe]|uniref:Interferon omega-1 n=1 Tax=Gossypium australe TaxID=47621 RepID=A0A5B6XAL4_9ROSI|nr:Interferon omega-1 [Gossypium australe]
MEGFRSKSYRDGDMQMDSYYYQAKEGGPRNMQDLRCYSANYANSVQPPNQLGKEIKMKKSKSTFGSSSKSWSFNDPELQRKKRVAGYKVYAVEGKMKGSLRKSFRWIKDYVLYGWR